MAKARYISRMAELVDALARGDGYTPARLPGVWMMKSATARMKSPVVYDASIVIIAQGRKRGYLGDKVYTYDANNYLVLSVPLPFECEVEASGERPLLGVKLGVEPGMVAELLLEMEESEALDRERGTPDRERGTPDRERGTLDREVPRGIFSTALDPDLESATLRLLESLGSDREARILGRGIVREIFYRVLLGEQGGGLMALAGRHTRFGQIARVLRQIHGDIAGGHSVVQMAAEARMSLSAFHDHFKAVTSASPLQYVKSMRLHRARLLMVQEGLAASEAAGRVGYESPSQFSREFKRHFGSTPAEEVGRLRSQYADVRNFGV